MTNPLDKSIGAHAAADEAEVLRLRSLSIEQKIHILDAACVAAEEIERGRLGAGMPPAQPAPWPDSTSEFLRRHAADVQR